jgi:predicted lipid-binding transport protein (Tim44 family)
MSEFTDRPATPHVESRDETIERVEAERQGELHRAPGASPSADPSERAGFMPRLLGTLAAGAIGGYIVAFLVAWAVEGAEPALHWGFAGALIGAVLVSLLANAVEDGRIARRTAPVSPGRTKPDQQA